MAWQRAKHAARLVRRPILTASARIDLSDARVGMKKRTLRSNQETDEGKRCAALANSLTKKAPYKGPWCRFRREARARERRRHWSCWMASAACLPRWAYALCGSGR